MVCGDFVSNSNYKKVLELFFFVILLLQLPSVSLEQDEVIPHNE